MRNDGLDCALFVTIVSLAVLENIKQTPKYWKKARNEMNGGKSKLQDA